MAIKNTRKSISENPSDDRLKKSLKENYKRFLTEAGDEEEDDSEISDDDLSDDLGVEDEGVPEEGADDLGGDPGLTSPLDDLNDTETEQVDAWLDELLGDSIAQVEVDGAASLDTEIPSSDLDPMGSQQLVHDDLPMSVDDLQNIINSDDSLSALETELSDLAVQQDADVEGDGDDFSLDNDPLADEVDDNEKLTENGNQMYENEDKSIEEAEDPMKGIEKYFDQGFEGEDVKDPLTEDVDLAPDNKEIGMEQVSAPLSDKVKQTVKPTPGARTREDIEVDQKGVVTESVLKSEILAKAALVINKQREELQENKKTIANLKLENYKLIKVNGLLSVAGDSLSKDARTHISENFDKCKTVEQVNNFYNRLTEKIKSAQRPSLNQVAGSKKTKINVIKESAGQEKNETLSREQMRKNMLMGLNTNDDVYFQ